MSIYFTKFQPTYLYIKQHSITGKLYFGKMATTRYKTPESYYGSGIRWQRHIKKYGKIHVVTLWYCLFQDQEECTSFALNFSEQQNIVKSEDWLNLITENGLTGTPPGTKFGTQSKESNEKRRKALTGIKHINRCSSILTQEHKDKIKTANTGKKRSKEVNDIRSNNMTGKKRGSYKAKQ